MAAYNFRDISHKRDQLFRSDCFKCHLKPRAKKNENKNTKAQVEGRRDAQLQALRGTFFTKALVRMLRGFVSSCDEATQASTSSL